MSKALYLLGFFCLIIMGCGEKDQSESGDQSQKVENKSELHSSAIKDLKFTDYALSSEAEEVIVNWEKYKELAIQIEYLKEGDMSFFNGEESVLIDFLKAFTAQIPEDLETEPILSRVALVETMILKLNEDLSLSNMDSNKKLDSILEVLVSFSNLNLQIDKKLERDFYDRIEVE